MLSYLINSLKVKEKSYIYGVLVVSFNTRYIYGHQSLKHINYSHKHKEQCKKV